jgi:UV DNA damage endonuclease
MRIGYPCVNRTVGCSSSRTFRLASWSPQRFRETVAANLACLGRVLAWNAEQGIRFFRITSDLVPFASHPVCDVDWRGEFGDDLAALGEVIRGAGARVTMHPDQFTLINSPDEAILGRSTAELAYHADLLDLLGAGREARVQIHVGGLYGDREAALERFVRRFAALPEKVRRRLAVENDDRLFPVADCLRLSRETGVPVVFDVFHHRCLNRGETVREALVAAAVTWPAGEPPVVDYSSQEPGRRLGSHAETLDETDFRAFLREAGGVDCDVMLEIKDKEKSALRAMRLAG